MSDFLKKFASIFVVDDDEGKKKSRRTEKQTASPSHPRANEHSSDNPLSENTTTSSVDNSVVSKKMTKLLLKAMEDKNLPGFDYLEFKHAFQSLKNMEMDEETRYKSVLSMAEAMGGSVESIRVSAKHYIEVLNSEYQIFQETLQQRFEKNILKPKSHIEMKQNEIDHKQQQIEALKKEISKLQMERDHLQENISTSSQKLERTKHEFLATYQHIKRTIQRDVEKIKQYLS